MTHSKNKQYKLTIVCEPVLRGSGNHNVVGVFLSRAWWNVFEYWLAVRLRQEGLKITSIVEEELSDEEEVPSNFDESEEQFTSALNSLVEQSFVKTHDSIPERSSKQSQTQKPTPQSE